MDDKELEDEIANILDRVPAAFRRRMENVAIVVAKRPLKRQMVSLGLDPERHTLFGLYEGTPLPRRSAVDPPLLPDKITIFSEPLMQSFPHPAALREQLRVTLLHEIAHYFGMDEKEIEKLGY